jgi:hypothetical protein
MEESNRPVGGLIHVSTPCTCGAARWFQCSCATMIATYKTHRAPDGPDMVHTKDVAYVKALHPGMDLIY